MSDFNHFNQIAAALEPACSQVVRKTCLDIVAGYQARAPRDTGFMANSAYIRTSEESTYGQGGGPTKKDPYLLPEVEAPENKTTAYAAVGANYSVYPELGTRYQPAQPAFYPAVEAVRPGFDQAMDLIRQKMEEAAQ